jgi:divalent metal cation (Fe/Co/Zn/Cd) transporter
MEATSLKILGVLFLALALYVVYEAATSLIYKRTPEHSPIGIAVAVVSLIVMPVLARAKRSVAVRLASSAVAADEQTEFCTYLSAILLCGLLLNAILGWWWADPAAGLLMVPIIAKEGWGALHGRTCCASCA